jgi:hypothetical protein
VSFPVALRSILGSDTERLGDYLESLEPND